MLIQIMHDNLLSEARISCSLKQNCDKMSTDDKFCEIAPQGPVSL